MIEAKNLRKIYKTKKGVSVNALDGVSLKLPDTGMVFILGKSGSGKSTLLNVLGGLDGFDSGEIIINGTSAKDFRQSHYDSYRNTYIGFIFQEYNVLEELTVGANVALAIELQGRRATNEEINSILGEVELDGLGARKPNELSGGQKQRVAIARALVKHPDIIMADEPTGALDSETGKQVFDTLKQLSRDKLVLIVSHDREFSERYADRIIELKDGVIISDVEKKTGEKQDTGSPSIVFSSGEITVKRGYELTEEDRLTINKYLAAQASDVKITSADARSETKSSSAEFLPTDESRIKPPREREFKLIKSRLSIKNAFKLGSGALKYKKFRLAFTIFLSIISFTLFGLADTIAAYNHISTATNSIFDTGVSYAAFSKLTKRYYGENKDEFYWTSGDVRLTPDDIDKIEEKTGLNVTGVYSKNLYLDAFSVLGDNSSETEAYEQLYTARFSGIVGITEELLKDNGFTLLEGSKLPTDKNEIVITKYIYDYFTKTGYSGADADGNRITANIASPADLIGKTIPLSLDSKRTEDYKIVGIVDTGFDYDRYEILLDPDVDKKLNTLELYAIIDELQSIQSYSFATILFVSPQLVEGVISSSVTSSIDGAINFIISSDPINGPDDHWFYEAPTTFYTYFNEIVFLEDAGQVVWASDAQDTLNENEVIVSSSVIYSYLEKSIWEDESKLYDLDALTGFERIVLEKMNLGEWFIYKTPYLAEILADPTYFATYKYVYDNYNSVLPSVKEYAESRSLTHELTELEVYSLYLEMSATGIATEVDEAYVSAYLDSVIAKYSLESLLLPEPLLDIVTKTYTYGDKTYTTGLESYNLTLNLLKDIHIIAAKLYAWENIDEALAYKSSISGYEKEELYDYIPSIIDEYVNYILQKSDFDTPDFQNYNTRFAEILLQTFTAVTELNGSKEHLVLSSYMGKIEDKFINSIKLVGVIPDSYSNDSSVIAINKELAEEVFGESIGGIYSFAVGNMPSGHRNIKKIVRFAYTYEANDVKYALENNVTNQLDMVEEILSVLGKVFLYVGIGFALFASLMLSNFIGTSVTLKKQEIGILRAIGSRSSDVFKIFFAESFIIAMTNFLLSTAATLAITLVINNALRESAGILVTFLSFSIRQVIVLLLVSLLVAIVATFLPVRKIASMKPIDAIKNIK